MHPIAPQEEQALRSQLEQARARLAGLERDLSGVESELESLSTERRQYRLLNDACAALEGLEELGAAGLFWGERAASSGSEELLRRARGRMDVFQKRLDEIETRQQAVLEEIARARDDAEIVEDDLYELKREEELRKLEWIVERELRPLPLHDLVMPWSRGGEDDQRFRKSLATALAASLLLGLLIPQIDLPLPERWEPIEVPERLTRLIREERRLPPPPPVKEETKPQEKELQPSEEKPIVAEKTPVESPTQQAPSKGILAFREKFSGLAQVKDSARLGSAARVTSSGEAASGMPQRSMLTTNAPGSSGGINLAQLSRDVGGGGTGEGVAGIQVARATSGIGGITGEDRPKSGGPGMSRTDEEIQIVFDRHKAALYRLYNRELRRDPTLKGQIILRMTIEPDGRVSLCQVQSSDMNAPQLSAQVVERVRTFDFGAKEGISAITILYPIDFLPAA